MGAQKANCGAGRGREKHSGEKRRQTERAAGRLEEVERLVGAFGGLVLWCFGPSPGQALAGVRTKLGACPARPTLIGGGCRAVGRKAPRGGRKKRRRASARVGASAQCQCQCQCQCQRPRPVEAGREIAPAKPGWKKRRQKMETHTYGARDGRPTTGRCVRGCALTLSLPPGGRWGGGFSVFPSAANNSARSIKRRTCAPLEVIF